MNLCRLRLPAFAAIAVLTLFACLPMAQAQAARPWLDKTLSPDRRADLLLEQMTLEEKLQMVHGIGWGVLRPGAPVPPEDNGGAGFVPGIPRLGLPGINLADSAVGVRMAAYNGRYATLLPSSLGAAASWDTDAALLYGTVIGRELRAQGFNMSIGGGVDLAREPRNGRNFEYAGEDPLLAGTMVGNLEKGVASQQVMNDIKHYALNDQETGRHIANVVISKRAMQESDLLAFQIALGIAQPAGVMCSYNKVNGDWTCENDYLLNHVLKQQFGFKGWVMSDWEATHSTVKAALAGLDQEQPGSDYFGDALKTAIANGQVPAARLDDMVHRILRSMIASGVVDDPPSPRRVVDPFQGRDDAQHIAEESIVLLKNAGNLLPLHAGVRSIALIGSHADVGVLSGGGSTQVDAPGGNAADPKHAGTQWGVPVYFPSSPLKNIRAKAPGAAVSYNDGRNVAAAAALARNSAVAIVFVNQYMSEGRDAKTLALPDNQDALVAAVAAANPNTIVVLETGGPVSMPWAGSVKGILEAWYPGIGGAQALANLLFGDVNPSGKLPITFAASEADLPHPQIPGMKVLPEDEDAASKNPSFDVNYTEGVRVGYKWFESEKKQPLFPFGYGLSYTTYAYSDLKVNAQQRTVSFTVQNTGTRDGAEIAQVYAELPASANEPFKRLVAWKRVTLAAGAAVNVKLSIDPVMLSIFNEQSDAFEVPPGSFNLFVGPSSATTPLQAAMNVK